MLVLCGASERPSHYVYLVLNSLTFDDLFFWRTVTCYACDLAVSIDWFWLLVFMFPVLFVNGDK